MHAESLTRPNVSRPANSPGRLWTGRVLSGLAILFFLMDGIMKLISPPPAPVVAATTHLGWPLHLLVPLGVLLLSCTVLYAIPRASLLGAILLTGYLGGAVATNARVGAPLFSNVLFPVYLGVFVWLGLYFRDHRLRAYVHRQN